VSVWDFEEVCGIEEIEDGRARTFEIGRDRIAVFRDGPSVHAVSARCPHSGGPLDRGWVEEHEAVCPLHRWRFRLSDGRCSTVRGERVRVFPCEVRDGRIFVGTDRPPRSD
jgi:NAD(P)H-dependent nitrite reductase small subunit